ncbi:MAG: sigma-70 family RNA polymerase sigma factor [Chloroflexota bacterium]|nr:sigma-70 family RNA polymerase sigma factor [Chloroflexota bacterium]
MTTNKAHALPDARQDDSAAAQFDATFLEHWQPIYRALMRLVGDHAEAEDLALETFWRLYQRPPSKQRDPNLGGWLYRVATNLGLNALRAHKRRQQHEMQAGKWAIETSASDPAQMMLDEEERARVRAVLATLDARQAQLLLLRHSGMAYRELGDALGVSVNSIGTLLARAEREFEKRYREKGDQNASQ